MIIIGPLCFLFFFAPVAYAFFLIARTIARP
jgi:hypothetical protein